MNKNLKSILSGRKTTNYTDQSTKVRSWWSKESLEEKINFNEKNLGGVLQGNSSHWPWRVGRICAGGSSQVVLWAACAKLREGKMSLPTSTQRKGSRGTGLICNNVLSRNHEGLPFIINGINIRSSTRFQSSRKDLINNSLCLSVIFICKFFLNFVNT